MVDCLVALSRLRLACWVPVKFVDQMVSTMYASAGPGRQISAYHQEGGWQGSAGAVTGHHQRFPPWHPHLPHGELGRLATLQPMPVGLSTVTCGSLSAGCLWRWQDNSHGRVGWSQDRWVPVLPTCLRGVLSGSMTVAGCMAHPPSCRGMYLLILLSQGPDSHLVLLQVASFRVISESMAIPRSRRPLPECQVMWSSLT